MCPACQLEHFLEEFGGFVRMGTPLADSRSMQHVGSSELRDQANPPGSTLCCEQVSYVLASACPTRASNVLLRLAVKGPCFPSYAWPTVNDDTAGLAKGNFMPLHLHCSPGSTVFVFFTSFTGLAVGTDAGLWSGSA